MKLGSIWEWGADLGTCIALSVGVGVMQYLSRVPWLSKNFIWLMNDVHCGQAGSVDAWLQAYHSKVIREV